MALHWLDIVALSVYLGGMVAMGIYFSRKNTNTEEYFVGGRSFAGWVIGLSLVGTSISSVTFLAYPGDAFKTAWLRYVPNFMLPVGILIASRVFLPFFRRGRITSAYEYLEGRFGPSIRVYGGAAFIIAQLVRLSTILYLVSLMVEQVTRQPPLACIVIAGVLVAVYTILGGIDAVIWTDVIQTIVLVLGGVVCLGVIVAKLPGGVGQIIEVASADGKLAFAELRDGALKPVPWGFSLAHKTFVMLLLVGLTDWLAEYATNQNVVQRYCASRSAKEARRAMWVCCCSSVPIWAFFMFLGTSLYVFFKEFPAEQAAQILEGAKGTKAEHILPFFIIHYLPPGVTGLVIAAALAAAMSSLDSSINAISAVGVTDIYRRHVAPGRDDKHYLRVAWVIATAAAAAMIGGAALLSTMKSKTLMDTGRILISLVGGGLLGLYLVGFLTRRGDARAVGVGIVLTVLFTVWSMLSDPNLAGRLALPVAWRVPFDLYYAKLIGNVLMFVVGYLLGCLLPKRERDLRNLTVWDQDRTPLE